MSMGAVARPGRLSLSRVAEQTFGVVGQEFVPDYLLALVAALPIALATAWRAQTALQARTIGPDFVGRFMGPSFWISTVVGLFFGALVYGALSWGAVERMQGRTPSFAEKLATAARAVPVLIGAGVIAYIGIVLGFICLVVPGLFLLTCWSLVAPVVTVETRGVIAGLGRSFELTRGARWSLFLILVIYGIGCMIASMIGGVLIRLVFGATGGMFVVQAAAGPALWASVLVNMLIGAALRVVGAVGLGVIYSELRGLNGFDTRRLNDVFA